MYTVLRSVWYTLNRFSFFLMETLGNLNSVPTLEAILKLPTLDELSKMKPQLPAAVEGRGLAGSWQW